MGLNKVSKKTVFIRVDGGTGIGLGHIMRMLVLADKLKKRYEVYFLCRNNNDYNVGVQKVEQSGFAVIDVSEDNLIEDIIKSQKNYNADVLITDSYSVDTKYFDATRENFKITGYVDDLNKCRLNVDFVINQNINAENLKYDVSKNTELFLGTKFCMMREEFKKAYEIKYINDKINNVLVTVGGMDNSGLSIELVRLLEDYNFKIHVVIGAAFSVDVRERLNKIADRKANVCLYENAVMSKLMLECDAAVSACGSTLYELCAMNVPDIGIIIAENQEQAALNMKKAGAVFDVVHRNELNKIKTLMDCLIKDDKLRNSIVNNQKNIVNINGAELLAENIGRLIESRCV